MNVTVIPVEVLSNGLKIPLKSLPTKLPTRLVMLPGILRSLIRLLGILPIMLLSLIR